ncbi:MAG: molybdopterin-dependent oxidoreductase [Anaerolineae bacterium]|nr:molybdopterin-dependent oxidoreductase [Anaerolineae bacterium]
MPAGRIIYTVTPLNAEPASLTDAPCTPVGRLFLRTHGTVPALEVATYRLRVTAPGHSQELTLTQLAALPFVEVTALLQCAGNRREELMAISPFPGEIPWGVRAAGNVRWGGYRLRDVLALVGVTANPDPDPDPNPDPDRAGWHVAFLGADEVYVGGQPVGFGGSVPLERALHPDTLLATHMNGEPLPPEHGYPVRGMVPGYYGARCVKWLAHISVQPQPSDNYYQQVAYRLHRPDSAAAPMLGPMPPTCAIDTVGRSGPAVHATGYAFGGEQTVAALEISLDEGHTWHSARLQPPAGPWGWSLWDITLPVPPGATSLIARTRGPQGEQLQPAALTATWNRQGYANNAWHRVSLPADPA